MQASSLLQDWRDLAERGQQLARRYKLEKPLSEMVIDLLKLDFNQFLSTNKTEYLRWLREHPKAMKRYSLARLEWLEDFTNQLAEYDDNTSPTLKFHVPKEVAELPWWEWYSRMRGWPPADFPPHLSWWVCLHNEYLRKR